MRRILDPIDVLREMCSLPHRGATTDQARRAATLLEERLRDVGATVVREPFSTPRTYLPVLAWILGPLGASLMLVQLASWVSVLVASLAALSCLLYFDWRWTPALRLPPQGIAENLLAYLPDQGPFASRSRSILLMAHYDSAPASVMYRASLVKNFRGSALLSLFLVTISPVLLFVNALGVGGPWIEFLCLGLGIYMWVLLIVVAWDFLAYGYVNGANDNAAGVAAAVATATRLWAEPIPGWQTCLLLTSAEEVGGLGSHDWFARHARDLDPARTMIINIDGGGTGDVCIVTRTGLLTRTAYDSEVVDAARAVAAEEPRFRQVRTSEWYTGDFDTVSPHRRGFSCLTLTTIGVDGRMANLHRPEDRFDNIDLTVPPRMVDFAHAVAVRVGRP